MKNFKIWNIGIVFLLHRVHSIAACFVCICS